MSSSEQPQQTFGTIPSSKTQTQLRACLRCSLVKTYDQFSKEGCENCPDLKMKGDKKRVEECTSQSFEGFIALTNPQKSWVARWQNIENRVPGIYAVVVHGELTE